MRTLGGVPVPVLAMENTGSATGRVEGFMTGKDASGREFELAPEDAPILPGRTREIALREDVEQGKTAPPIRYPLSVKGTLEIGRSRAPVELRFNP